MSAIHHNIIKAIRAAGASIEEVTNQSYSFVLTNDALMLRATGDDARELRQLAQDWARGENIDGYGVEDALPEDDETQAASSSVIKSAFRDRYKENGGGCGDWLHHALNELTKNPHGDFDVDAFTDILERNGVDDWAKYRNPGLLRMSGGVRLRAIVKRTGVLKTPDGDLVAPKD
jgi:hypothetical protein